MSGGIYLFLVALYSAGGDSIAMDRHSAGDVCLGGNHGDVLVGNYGFVPQFGVLRHLRCMCSESCA